MIYSSNGTELTTNTYNVKTFGAKGDGITDDSTAINTVLRHVATNGGTIYFPEGTYLISETLLFKSNQTLLFENNATLLADSGIDSILRNYAPNTIGGYDATKNVDIIGGTFDGGTGTNNITLVAFCHSLNIRIKNCTFKNAYGAWHDLEINSSKHVTVDNCDFEGSRKTSTSAELIQIEACDTNQGYPWNAKVDGTLAQNIEIKSCYFHDSTSVAIGNHAWIDSKYISIHDNIFENFTNNRGTIYFRQYDYVDVYNNTFIDCTIGAKVEVSGVNNLLHDNKFIGVTTVSSGFKEYDNYVNGSLNIASYELLETVEITEPSTGFTFDAPDNVDDFMIIVEGVKSQVSGKRMTFRIPMDGISITPAIDNSLSDTTDKKYYILHERVNENIYKTIIGGDVGTTFKTALLYNYSNTSSYASKLKRIQVQCSTSPDNYLISGTFKIYGRVRF